MRSIYECPVCGNQRLETLYTCIDHLFTKRKFLIKKCVKCTLCITSPQPSEKEIVHYYPPDYAPHKMNCEQINQKIINFLKQIRADMLRRTIEKHTLKGGCLLEIGCGAGYLINNFKNSGWIVHGIEFNKSAARNCEKKHGIPIIYSSEPPKDIGKFDLVIMWHVLEHLIDINHFFYEISKLLKTHGFLVIAIPNQKSLDKFYYREKCFSYDVPRHLFHFTPKSVSRLAKKYFFELKVQKPLYFESFYIPLKSEMARKKNIFGLLKGICFGILFFLVTIFCKSHTSGLVFYLKKI